MTLAFCWAWSSFAQSGGEKLFKTYCTACHTIGKGKLVGPDLKGVETRRKEDWLIKFIKSSQTMVKAGDAQAVKVFNDYGKIPMPDQNLSDAEIKSIIGYIKQVGAPKVTTTTTTTTTVAKNNTVTTTTTTNTAKVDTVKKEEPAPKPEWVPSAIAIPVAKVSGEINAKDFKASIWDKAKAVTIPIEPQRVTYPTLQGSSVPSVTVKSVYSGKQLAFLVEWDDATKDYIVDVDRFCDQFAIQLPVDTSDIPSYMMGNPDGLVHITHWKAIWQEDCENGFRDVQDAYPNMWVDIYPGLEEKIDRSNRTDAKDITAEQIVSAHYTDNMPGTYSKNPMSIIKRKTPVEEASAEGFGTLTTQETQAAMGWAAWENNKWRLCIVVPINTGNIYKAVAKYRTKVAFAVWNGNFQNIGGRKHYSLWNDLIFEQ